MRSDRGILTLLVMLDVGLIMAGAVKFNNIKLSNEAYACSIDNDKSVAVSDIDTKEKYVVPSGEPIGIYVKSEGVMVIGTGQVKGEDGQMYSPCQGLVEAGDYILSVEGQIIDDKVELADMVNNYGGNEIDITVEKKAKDDNTQIFIETVSITPVASESGDYMLGLWVKDDISGIGTLTYYDEKSFGALGHSINDNDTGEIFQISDGAIYSANLVNIVKSNRHIPGRLEGIIDYTGENMIGRVGDNSYFGVKGSLTGRGKQSLDYGQMMPVAKKEEIEKGEAFILSSVSGQPRYYSIEIMDIMVEDNSGNKQLQIRVTDPALIELTSGIVQGMSGTPIIQNGKLVGAVTHVLVNDPTKGYGIFIENMLEY